MGSQRTAVLALAALQSLEGPSVRFAHMKGCLAIHRKRARPSRNRQRTQTLALCLCICLSVCLSVCLFAQVMPSGSWHTGADGSGRAREAFGKNSHFMFLKRSHQYDPSKGGCNDGFAER